VKVATFESTVVAENRNDAVDVNDDLVRAVKDSGISRGCVVAFCAHTTCGLIVNEWEDGALEDLRKRLEELVPSDVYYAHDDLGRRTQNLIAGERSNGRAHVAQMILGGTSHAIPIDGGEPVLGRWQHLYLLELDEPKPRTVLFHVFGE
jgi:secondary thiamine-phosphate synthase enzyme